ncbi:MAG: hypothetical protein QGH45_21140, partial [Myxococcota bacterium]|nr:hypothetical protein [Myxococcota bacterium]
MHTIDLNGTWAVRQGEFAWIGEEGLGEVLGSEEDWLEAIVPGEIHLDLMRARLMPEPTVGTNMRDCRWPETRSWWFRRELELDAGFLDCERQLLTFDGLDLNAQIFVNGSLLGECANAFVPQSFDVRGQVRPGTNELVVRLTAGSELARDATPAGAGPEEYAPNPAVDGTIPNPPREDDLTGHRRWFGYKWLRKPQFSYGWDWVDPLPNIGIWRGVRLEGRSHASLQSLRLDTRRGDGTVTLEMEAVVENLHSWSERACVLSLEIVPPDGSATIRKRYELSALPGRSPVRDTIAVPNPQL